MTINKTSFVCYLKLLWFYNFLFNWHIRNELLRAHCVVRESCIRTLFIPVSGSTVFLWLDLMWWEMFISSYDAVIVRTHGVLRANCNLQFLAPTIPYRVVWSQVVTSSILKMCVFSIEFVIAFALWNLRVIRFIYCV